MKIAFDAQLFLKGDKTGIAWNAHYLILELAKDDAASSVTGFPSMVSGIVKSDFDPRYFLTTTWSANKSYWYSLS